jgi:hypothetical protein
MNVRMIEPATDRCPRTVRPVLEPYYFLRGPSQDAAVRRAKVVQDAEHANATRLGGLGPDNAESEAANSERWHQASVPQATPHKRAADDRARQLKKVLPSAALQSVAVQSSSQLSTPSPFTVLSYMLGALAAAVQYRSSANGAVEGTKRRLRRNTPHKPRNGEGWMERAASL